MANLRLVRVLADAGHEVDVITYPFGTAPPHPRVRVHRCPKVPFVQGVGIGFSTAKLAMDASLYLFAKKIIRDGGFDCVHGIEEGVFIAAATGRRVGLPVVYDMDSVMSHDAAASWVGRLPLAIGALSRAERWAVRNAAMVLTISDSMADFVKRIDPKKNIGIAPDVPLPLPAGGMDKDRALVEMPPEARGKRIVLYTGSLAGYQGLDLLIEAARDMPEALFVIVGGDEKGISRLKKIPGVGNTVFMGKKPAEEVPHYLAAADVLVSPRRSGVNPPYKIYTYMQAGIPIVATDIPAHTTVLDKSMAELVPVTPEGLAAGIGRVFAEPVVARERAERAKGLVANLTLEFQAERILQAYDTVEICRR